MRRPTSGHVLVAAATAVISVTGQSEYRVLAVPVQGGTPRVVADNARLMTVFHRD